jgi:hypothetical protein
MPIIEKHYLICNKCERKEEISHREIFEKKHSWGGSSCSKKWLVSIWRGLFLVP